MRPRHVLILVVLAAIPVGLALGLAGVGGGGTKHASGVPPTQLSLELVGGTTAAAIGACGGTHHYTAYAAGSEIAFRGTISPSAHVSNAGWSVKVKLKACTGGAFRASGAQRGTIHAGGRYKASIPAPIAGDYFARAELKRSGELVARSSKQYFEVR
jgi:hypothetical protein